ncbi:hypothetical protein Hhaem_16850 [Haemophilus haemolyticus]|uniref:YadA-like family protein n=1 Tax=Haemophilus haemolyticus TaxID=726 RepID=UPI001CC6DBDE|nr:YadA-like family protein [Haemophilus haemolyticus]BCL67972.1 hypothetical protein Hhaem_16850 [Haemophilus haemolyticus]
MAGELASAKGKSASKTVSTLTALSVVSVLGVSSAMAAVSIDVYGQDLAIKQAEVNKAVTTIKEGSLDDKGNRVKAPDQNIIVINNGQQVNIESDGKDRAKNVIVIGSQNENIYDEQILIGYGFNSPKKKYSLNAQSAGKAGDVAIGNRITLGGSDSSGPAAKDSFSTAVGYGSQAVGPVVAMGVGARSDMAAFDGWKSVKEGVVAVGPFALGANNQNSSTAVGALSAANHNYAVSLGALSGAANDWEDRGLGEQFDPSQSEKTQEEREAASMYKIREGAYATNLEVAPTSVGYKAAARGYSSTAIGQQALTGSAHTRNGWNSTAVGVGAHAVKDNSLALGDKAIAGGLTADEIKKLDDEISRLNGLKTLAETRLADAEKRLNTDTNPNADPSAENKFKVASATAALERIKLAIERAKHDKELASENNSNTQFSIAVGSHAQATNYRATAIGRMSRAKGYSSNAIGNQAVATGKNSNAIGSTTTEDGKDNVIKATQATGENSIAFGTGVGSNANNTIGIGSLSDVNGANSIAVGNSNKVSAENVTVVGNNIAVNNENGKTRNGAVVLGDSSDGLLATNPVTSVSSATVNGVLYSGFKGDLSNLEEAKRDGRFVSVGSKDNERQIKHVAAGEISKESTDAINGSQLYMVADKVGQNKKDIAANKTAIDANKTAIDEIKGNITNINQTIADNHWIIADDKLNNTSKVEKGNTVTFKGENGVNVSLDSNNKTVTISGDSSNTPTVYTDKDGNKVVNNNGKFFKVDANGKPTTTEVKNDDVIVSVKNPNAGKDKAGAPTTITNVKDAKLTDDSKDAVNGSQLYKTNSDVKKNADSINNLTNQVNGNKDKIGELDQRINNINTNINNAVGDQVRNINKRIDGVENRVNHLDNKINNVDKRASRGIATAGAMGMLPQPHISGRSMVSAATTSYRGQQSLAVGYSRLSDNGKHIIKFSGASNLAGKKDAMVGAAYGYQW